MEKNMGRITVMDSEEVQELIQSTVRNELDKYFNETRFGIEFRDEVWDRKKVSEFLGISPEKVTELFNKREIPGKKLGREYFFLKSQIINLFKKGRS